MTLQQLKYVIEIVNCGSISEAAKKLYISQPSLSNALKELEKEMNIEIFTRTSKGISLTLDGSEFLSYARQIMEQTQLLENRYKKGAVARNLCSVSTQHYSFAVDAFSSFIKNIGKSEYDFTLRETRTHEIIDDVKNFRSEIGILYVNDFNEKVILKLIAENGLEFKPLFTADAHVFISHKHPLANKKYIKVDELENYPFLCFEQGENNSFFFSEEILSILPRKKVIHVSDRATLFNLVIGLNGYTICSGILNNDFNGDSIIPVPLKAEEKMNIGYIVNPKAKLSSFAKMYIDELEKSIKQVTK